MIIERYRFAMPFDVFHVVLLLLISNQWPCFLARSILLICRQEERAALVEFKQGLQLDPSSDFLRSWEGEECCEWEGLSCDNSTQHVIKLELLPPRTITNYFEWVVNWFGVLGTIPNQTRSFHISGFSPSLLTLRNLNHLDLSGVRLRDATPIPQFMGSMRCLNYLNLSNTGFVGAIPDFLGNLTHLEVLDLGVYDDSSDLSLVNTGWISHLTALKYLDLSGISPRKPEDLMQVLNTLPFLSHLALASCSLGYLDISSGLFNSTLLSNLQHLDLSSNRMFGPIPSPLRNMTSIIHLDLSRNFLGSSVPVWFGNFRDLVHLNLEMNDFEIIEQGFSFFIGDKCQLRFLSLAYNLFNGEIGEHYSGFCAFDLELLNLGYNYYSGVFPDWLCNLKRLEHLNLGFNSFSGPVSDSLGTLKSLKKLDLSRNQFLGSIPRPLGQLRSLQCLDLSSNILSGTVPEGLGQLSRLVYLDLSGNSLEGTLSESHFTNLSRLKYLDISSNDLASRWIPIGHHRSDSFSSGWNPVDLGQSSRGGYNCKRMSLH